MFVSDEVVWATVFGSALFFTALGAWFPLHVPEGKEASAGLVWGYLRAVVFPLLAGASWYVLSAMSISLNNCIAAFASCYTSPTFATTTTSIYVGQFDYQLYLYFEGLAIAEFIIGTVLAFYYAFRPLIREPLEE